MKLLLLAFGKPLVAVLGLGVFGVSSRSPNVQKFDRPPLDDVREAPAPRPPKVAPAPIEAPPDQVRPKIAPPKDRTPEDE